jgi:hypothetical protein
VNPFIYITTHRVEDEVRAELETLLVEYHRLLLEEEPDLLEHYAYFDDSRGELTLIQIHRDAASAERHMQVAGELIQKGVALTTPVRVEVYGDPGPAVSRALTANGDLGAQVVVARQPRAGFSRFSEAAFVTHAADREAP